MDKGKGVIGNQLDHADLSKIRILLYDINAESCHEILALLCKCPYQAAVWSAREVYETLKSEGHETHIILAEVNLLMANDARMLRYIMRDKKLQQIPVIILTTQDQVPTTIKGMCLGAADYLVKPLHDDELSSLWMYIMHK